MYVRVQVKETIHSFQLPIMESGKIEDSMYVFHLSTKQQKHSVLIYCQCKPLRTCPNTRVTVPKVMLIPDPRANPNSKFKKTAKDIPPFFDVVP